MMLTHKLVYEDQNPVSKEKFQQIRHKTLEISVKESKEALEKLLDGIKRFAR
ncbi:MAG: hypothetical protein ACMUEM_02135 [Flavobacteriales bacterium AspAUS03]